MSLFSELKRKSVNMEVFVSYTCSFHGSLHGRWTPSLKRAGKARQFPGNSLHEAWNWNRTVLKGKKTKIDRGIIHIFNSQIYLNLNVQIFAVFVQGFGATNLQWNSYAFQFSCFTIRAPPCSCACQFRMCRQNH